MSVSINIKITMMMFTTGVGTKINNNKTKATPLAPMQVVNWRWRAQKQ